MSSTYTLSSRETVKDTNVTITCGVGYVGTNGFKVKTVECLDDGSWSDIVNPCIGELVKLFTTNNFEEFFKLYNLLINYFILLNHQFVLIK